jgi:phosphoribosylanthranilate isomerase
VARARQIIQAVPGDYLKVGIFVNPAPEEAAKACDDAMLDVAQLHGTAEAYLGPRRVWDATQSNYDELSYPVPDAFLIDTPSEQFGGSGRTFDWNRLKSWPSRFRLIIAGGLDSSNVAEAIALARPWGVDACSRLEVRAGQKDMRKVEAFVNAAREAFRVHMQQEISQ